MTLNEKLVEIIEREVQFQRAENLKHDEKYRRSSKYHTKLVEQFLVKVTSYPHYAVALLQKHIAKEDLIFGQEISETSLTPEEQGRIYSLVRCKHMLRIAKEEMAG